MIKKIIGERLKAERKRLGYETALAFSDNAGFPQATYRRWEAGASSPGADELGSLVTHGVDALYVVTGQRSSGGAAEGSVRIPVMAAEPSAGYGAVVSDSGAMVRGFLDVQHGWASEFLGPNLGRMKLMFANGNSMAPTVWHGDPVFVDEGVKHFDGEGIYVFDFMGELLIKRLLVDLVGQTLTIKSDNEREFPAQVVPAADVERLHICGKVHTWLNVRRG